MESVREKVHLSFPARRFFKSSLNFQKSTYVEHLANELVLMETTINIYNYGGHTGLYKFHSLHSHNNNMVLLSRHSADTSPFFSIVWYSLSIIPVL